MAETLSKAALWVLSSYEHLAHAMASGFTDLLIRQAVEATHAGAANIVVGTHRQSTQTSHMNLLGSITRH